MNFESNVNNNPSLLSSVLDFLFENIGGVINAMQSIYLFASVSLFDFSVALLIMTIVVTYLVNVAKRPDSGTYSEVAEFNRRGVIAIRNFRNRMNRMRK